jgi:lysophospholipase L1-like esterase
MPSGGTSSSGGSSSASSSGGDASYDGSSASDGADASTSVQEGGHDASVCPKGQVTPNRVVMIGDSYLDPSFSNAALDIFADAQMSGALPANTTYRHYYQGGASMSSGALQFNIPYQYESEALLDPTVSNPSSIDTIIMDGGGNDVLINDRSCLTQAPPANTGCVNTIQGVVSRATSLMQEMGRNGVKNVVYFFYPHLDPAGGGLLPTPAPGVNDTLDYAYPLAQQLCAAAPQGGPRCFFIDLRPAFEGHIADYINPNDHVHPTPAGAKVIADLVWQTMESHCIAQ